MELRKYREEDLKEIIDLFYETVCTVNRKDYSKEQIEVWANRKDTLLQRKDFFTSLYTIVATEEGKIVGYGNIDHAGYIDHLFVHKDYQGKKIATAICDELEQYSLAKGNTKITVHASITALPFFKGRGYCIKKEQKVKLNGIELTNYTMEKILV